MSIKAKTAAITITIVAYIFIAHLHTINKILFVGKIPCNTINTNITIVKKICII